MTAERQIMSREDIRRALNRVSHEILERNRGPQDLVLVGIYTRGVPLANRLAANIAKFEGSTAPVAALDINLYRDDLQARDRPVVRPTDISVDLHGKKVVLVDDVLYTGRTIRAALDALSDFRTPQRGAIGNPAGPGSPGVAHPARLRRPEHPDCRRRAGQGPPVGVRRGG